MLIREHSLGGNMCLKALVLAALLCFVALRPVHAQEVRASITGVVSDPSGAPIPGAKVTITNVGRNTTVATDTNDSGAYITPLLEPGTYTVTVERSGFKRS